jgi:hypothetical protein
LPFSILKSSYKKKLPLFWDSFEVYKLLSEMGKKKAPNRSFNIERERD